VGSVVTEGAWRQARLEWCPLHPGGGCGFVRHGTYPRRDTAGMRVARWYCRQARMSFSLLPDCLCSRLRGSLDDAEGLGGGCDGDRETEEQTHGSRVSKHEGLRGPPGRRPATRDGKPGAGPSGRPGPEAARTTRACDPPRRPRGSCGSRAGRLAAALEWPETLATRTSSARSNP